MPATNCEQLQSGALDFHSLLIIAAEPEPAGPTVNNGEPTKNRRRTSGEPLYNTNVCIQNVNTLLIPNHIAITNCPNTFNIQETWLALPVLIFHPPAYTSWLATLDKFSNLNNERLHIVPFSLSKPDQTATDRVRSYTYCNNVNLTSTDMNTLNIILDIIGLLEANSASYT